MFLQIACVKSDIYCIFIPYLSHVRTNKKRQVKPISVRMPAFSEVNNGTSDVFTVLVCPSFFYLSPTASWNRYFHYFVSWDRSLQDKFLMNKIFVEDMESHSEKWGDSLDFSFPVSLY